MHRKTVSIAVMLVAGLLTFMWVAPVESSGQPAFVSAIEGLAAGAMLTMIAQTMIPEAVQLGGANIVGLSTLAGFLAAVAFKILEA